MKNRIFTILAISLAVTFVACNEEETCVETTWHYDGDADGLGNADSTIIACEMPSGFVTNSDDENDALAEGEGQVNVRFDNVVGDDELSLVSSGSTSSFPYVNSLDQSFNLDLLGYYITEIKLIGMGETEDYIDQVSVNVDGSLGVYHVLENEPESQVIIFTDVPDGIYGGIEFTLGIPGDLVEEGAIGGILDPSNGAWFWNWNAGYVAFMMEGNSNFSGQVDSEHFAFHIGGWGATNNIKTINLDLPHHLIVADGSMSMAHIKMDALKALSGESNIDFTSSFMLHSPVAGEPIAVNLVQAFEVHHVENN